MGNLKIYCEQYGYYWSFTPKEFLALCSKSIQNKPGGFELPDKNQLKGKPKDVYNPERKPRGTKYPVSGQDAYSASPDVILYHPLDWGREEYREAAREVMMRLQKRNLRRK